MVRNRTKIIVKIIFRCFTWPLYVLYQIVSCINDPDASFASFSQFLSLFPGKTGSYLRAAFYTQACPGTSDDIVIGFLTILSHRDTTIEGGVYIGPQCNIGKCSIGANTLIGSGVHILSGNRQHHFDDVDKPIQQQGGFYEKVSIGQDCWIGNKCTVMAELPAKTIVAAGSVVTRRPSTGDIIAGNPAKTQRNRLTPSTH